MFRLGSVLAHAGFLGVPEEGRTQLPSNTGLPSLPFLAIATASQTVLSCHSLFRVTEEDIYYFKKFWSPYLFKAIDPARKLWLVCKIIRNVALMWCEAGVGIAGSK